jgi:threonine dehydrogenase-like Zn-dependent dehydrogenase
MEIDPPCRQCRDGSYGICENAGIRPLPRDVGGGFSPFMVAHRTQLFHVPDHVPRDRDVLLEPTAAAAHAVLKRPPQPGERVLVIGAGSIGLLTLAVVRPVAPRADVHCLVRHAFQGTAAAAMGASVHR